MKIVSRRARQLKRQFKICTSAWTEWVESTAGSDGTPYELAANVSDDVYAKFMEFLGDRPSCRIGLRDGRVIIYELLMLEHEGPLGYISDLLAYYDMQEGGVFEKLRSQTCQIAPGVWKEADESVRLRGRVPSPIVPGIVTPIDGWATFIVEVGWSESITDLDQDAQHWLHPYTDVQAVLIFKLYLRREDGSVPMFAALYERDHGSGTRSNGRIAPTWAISFGTAPLQLESFGTPLHGIGVIGDTICNALAIPLYVRQIPAVHFYYGIPGNIISPDVQAWSIDLFVIQTRFLEFIS